MNDCKCGTPHSQVYEIWWIQHVSIVTLKTSGSQQALLTFQVLIGLITGLMPKKKKIQNVHDVILIYAYWDRNVRKYLIWENVYVKFHCYHERYLE